MNSQRTQSRAVNAKPKVTFIKNPYVHGSDIRTDTANKAFTVIFYGQPELAEDDPAFATCTLDAPVCISHSMLFSKACELAKNVLTQIDFHPNNVKIFYQQKYLVLGGIVRGTNIEWLQPVYNEMLRKRLMTFQKYLRNKAYLVTETNNNTALSESLFYSANEIELSLTNSNYVNTSDYFTQELRQLTLSSKFLDMANSLTPSHLDLIKMFFSSMIKRYI